ncbi:hypothetical protein PYW07_016261 [Mythimna separata]|uniref:Uncharacterized protein n=1 Tax=Mythimna separata TaxID=271217 RepID=A0AAD7YRK7_MYTSE|nr:hypothetical protein PYW07_016261 [Mythimna separata]
METLLEEIALIAGGSAASTPITPAAVDHAVAHCADLWGLLQPYSHLNAGRVASGALSLSRWESMSSLGSGSSSGVSRPEHRQLGLSHDSGITTNGSGGSGTSAGSNNSSGGSTASVLLTTCAGSASELRAVLRRVHPRLAPLSPAAERALYYFMRCSQLEHSSSGSGCGGLGLWGARGAGALPPLGEWVRVLRAHASLRPPPAVPDADDVLQAARLLLPHADCPPRPIYLEEAIEPVWSRNGRTADELGRCAVGVAQRALLSGRAELLGGVRALLPPAGLDAPDAAGLTALMKAAFAGDEQIVAMLLEAGADPNIETGGACAAHCALPLSPRSPSTQQTTPTYTPPTAGWTALVYACSGAGGGAVECARRLLAAGARVDGAPARGDDVCTLTPLQWRRWGRRGVRAPPAGRRRPGGRRACTGRRCLHSHTATGKGLLVYACSGAGGGAVECARRLLAAGARVDGAPARGDDVCTLTPLQCTHAVAPVGAPWSARAACWPPAPGWTARLHGETMSALSHRYR